MQTVGAGEAKQTLSAACSGGQGTPSSSEHHNRYSAVTKEWLLSETARCMCFSLHMYTTLKAVWLQRAKHDFNGQGLNCTYIRTQQLQTSSSYVDFPSKYLPTSKHRLSLVVENWLAIFHAGQIMVSRLPQYHSQLSTVKAVCLAKGDKGYGFMAYIYLHTYAICHTVTLQI